MSSSIRFMQVVLLFVVALGMSGCAETQLASHYAKKIGSAQTGSYKVGKPYKVEGEWYYPKEDFGLTETGIASWYGPDFHGKKTANGERYDQYELTAAHRTLPMPSLVRVTNLANGRSIVVRINDRGPFKRGRVIDVSRRGAELLGFIQQGTARVRIQVLENESRKIAEAARRGMDTSRLTMADLNRMQPISYTPDNPPPPRGQMATLVNDAETLPDSLKVPTITVEELSTPGRPAGSAVVSPPPVNQPVQGHYSQGVFMPDAVVTTETVRPTGIFVQAGSFAVLENAQRLSQKLGSIAPAKIDTLKTGGRTLYRVKLGPIASVEEADRVLSQVVQAGNATARVVHH